MKQYGIFDILGPVMIGPSSSHTAGAARLGKIASQIAKPGYYKVTFFLHGSFAKTYQGHGTDKALVAGILGMDPDDENLIDSLKKANDLGLEIDFKEADLGCAHPNTVKMLFSYSDMDDYYITGSSIGGGNITINNLNGVEIEFTRQYPTTLIQYEDMTGIISKITCVVAKYNINIATLNVSREESIATMIMETDSNCDDNILDEISMIQGIKNVISINKNGGI